MRTHTINATGLGPPSVRIMEALRQALERELALDPLGVEPLVRDGRADEISRYELEVDRFLNDEAAGIALRVAPLVRERDALHGRANERIALEHTTATVVRRVA